MCDQNTETDKLFDYLFCRACIAAFGALSEFITNMQDSQTVSSPNICPIENLMEEIKNRNIRKPREIKVDGMFYPGVLLTPGWWDRTIPTRRHFNQRNDALRQWLYHGFEQWAPSWEWTLHTENDKDNDKNLLLGQFGYGDESNSIPVVIPRNKAAEIRDMFLDKGNHVLAKKAEIRGELQHHTHMSKKIYTLLEKNLPSGWRERLDYCLVIKPKKEHYIHIQDGSHEIYSGYLWQCVCPQTVLDELEESDESEDGPSINDVYFIWEHTDFANESSLRYNMDSLVHKRDLLQKRFGDTKLVTLQRSAWYVEQITKDTPLYTTKKFRKFISQKLNQPLFHV